MRRVLLAVCFGLIAGQSLADTILVRPKPRPTLEAPIAEETAPDVTVDPAVETLVQAGLGPLHSIRPQPRPSNLETEARNPKKGLLGKLFGKKPKTKSDSEAARNRPKKGSVCGDAAIRGEVLARITSKVKGCGISEPVKVTEVDGVRLSMAATLDCEAARALRKWVSNTLQPAFSSSKVTELKVAAHYACRPRNNVRGARVSEHGRGKAIDIAGFTLANGTSLTVRTDYKSKKGALMRKVHKGACGTFGTTLGPGSDGYHEDHLHFDTARYRGGSYCR